MNDAGKQPYIFRQFPLYDMLDYCVRFEIDGSCLPTRSRRRNYYGLNAEHAVYDSCLPRSVWKKKIKTCTDDWIPSGVDEVYMAHFVG